MAATLKHMPSIFKGWKFVPNKNNADKETKVSQVPKTFQEWTDFFGRTVSLQSTCIHKSTMNSSAFCRRETPDANSHGQPPDHRRLHPKWEHRAKLHLRITLAKKSSKHCNASWVSCNEQAWEFCNCLIPYLVPFLFNKFPQLPCIWKKRTSHLLYLSWPRFLTHFYCYVPLCKEKTPNIHLPQFRNGDTW